MVALKILTGDTSGASTAVNYYFQHQFLDQIAKSGEQPFEAVRTRPFHYRCFNLEAMIVSKFEIPLLAIIVNVIPGKC